MAKELNETFPGIEAVNDFYTPYYMKEYFPDEVKNASAPWKQLPPEKRPARLLKDMRQSFTEVINNNENDLFPAERVRNFIDGMLVALGYTQEGNQPKTRDCLTGFQGSLFLSTIRSMIPMGLRACKFW